ncbi:Lipid binding protein [Giardia muris]|uniref:Lipid binding protein n=1 Tax=Giardia muris TaxID=5742 RepID=A0A4Z1SQY3_GIAMU|nr:Lipid binding protein [Giardia muris]|eukprot:TNJ28110.1 Lipid binding protein [Giardia muris]
MPIATGPVPAECWTDIKKAAKEGMEASFRLLENGAWKDPKIEEGLSVTTATVDGSKCHALKAELEIPYPPQSCVAAALQNLEIPIGSSSNNTRFLARKPFWENDEGRQKCEQVAAYYNPNSFATSTEPSYDLYLLVQYVVASPSSLIAPREFVTARHCQELEKGPNGRRFCISSVSWEPSNLTTIFPESDKTEKWVRGTLHAQLYLFEETSGGKTKATFLVHSDPQGSVPAALVNKTLVNQAKALTEIDVCLKSLVK